MRYSLKFLCLLFFPTMVWADGANDLRTSLQNLHGHTTVKVDMAYSIHKERSTVLNSVTQERSLRLQVVEDGTGLHVDWHLPSSDRVAGQPSTTGTATTAEVSLEEVMEGLDAITLEGFLNQADELSKEIETARFRAEGSETYQGRPVRVLTFSCQPRILSQHQGLVTQAESTLKVWIGDDGAPIASEASLDYIGQHSRLYGRIHWNSLVKTTYAILDRRLVVAHRSSKETLYDLGDKMKRNLILTLAKKG